MGIVFSTLTTQNTVQELEGDGGSRAPGAAEPFMTLSPRELCWVGEVTLRSGTASCSSWCKGTWLGARACAKACEGAGGACEFCNQLAVHFLYFCLRLGHTNTLANNPLRDINDKTLKEIVSLLGYVSSFTLLKLLLLFLRKKNKERNVSGFCCCFSPLFAQPLEGFIMLWVLEQFGWRMGWRLDFLSPFPFLHAPGGRGACCKKGPQLIQGTRRLLWQCVSGEGIWSNQKRGHLGHVLPLWYFPPAFPMAENGLKCPSAG